MIRLATLEDAFDLAPRLREADRRELEAQGLVDFDVVLAESLAMSDEPLAFEVDGEVLALFGCAPGQGYGIPWLLGSESLFEHPRVLLSLPFDYIPVWLAKYGLLQNMVHGENLRSIRWLRRLGFSIGAPFTLPGGSQFHPFFMRQDLCAGP